MSVLIKGMEMPTNCGECKFLAWKRGVGNHCAIDVSITFHPTLDGLDVRYEKNGTCPLVPVPPHGRLIDADVLIKANERSYEHFKNGDEISVHESTIAYLWASEIIRNAPTIIEAEGEE